MTPTTPPRVAPNRGRLGSAIVLVAVGFMLTVGFMAAIAHLAASAPDPNLARIASLEASLTAQEAASEALAAQVTSLTVEAEAWRIRAQEASAAIEAVRAEKMARKQTPAPKPKQVSNTAPATDGFRTCRASWYGPGLYGNWCAGGVMCTPDLQGVAHRSLAFGTLITIRYNGGEVTVPVVDRGPYVGGRTFDLCAGTAAALGFSGVQTIEYRIGG